jgi:hypothetical protein
VYDNRNLKGGFTRRATKFAQHGIILALKCQAKRMKQKISFTKKEKVSPVRQSLGHLPELQLCWFPSGVQGWLASHMQLVDMQGALVE